MSRVAFGVQNTRLKILLSMINAVAADDDISRLAWYLCRCFQSDLLLLLMLGMDVVAINDGWFCR